MLEIDGSQKSGSGTILRLSIALAAIHGEPIHLFNIRAGRNKPGLRPQHLEAIITAAKICNASAKGLELGSKDVWFQPGRIKGGIIKASIGTAGSISMLIMTVLPICIYADRPVCIHISKGGTDVRHAPTINYIKYVFLPVLRKMGIKANLRVDRYGYYPFGMGEVRLYVQPCTIIHPLVLDLFGRVEKIKGVSVCSYLSKNRVAERQAKSAERIIQANGFDSDINVVNDFSNLQQKGSSLVLWTRTSTNVLFGSDMIGERGKPSELIGRQTAVNLCRDIQAEVTVDEYLADMLIPYISLTEGYSTYLAPYSTTHLETNIWIVRMVTDINMYTVKEGNLLKVIKE